MNSIDLNSPVPLIDQLLRELRSAWAHGELQPGDVRPSGEAGNWAPTSA